MRNILCLSLVLLGLGIVPSDLLAIRSEYVGGEFTAPERYSGSPDVFKWQNQGNIRWQNGDESPWLGSTYDSPGYGVTYDNQNVGVTYDNSYGIRHDGITYDASDYAINYERGAYYDGADATCCAPCTGGECLTLCCCYQPCYYNTWRCIQVPKTCQKRCCRYVPREYQVQHCRYIPQYYTETCCCYVPEYYYVDETVMCEKWISERQCQSVLRYFYKRIPCQYDCACQ